MYLELYGHQSFSVVVPLHAVVDSCSTCIRKSIFSLMMRLNTSINVIMQRILKSDVYTTSELYQRWVKALYT